MAVRVSVLFCAARNRAASAARRSRSSSSVTSVAFRLRKLSPLRPLGRGPRRQNAQGTHPPAGQLHGRDARLQELVQLVIRIEGRKALQAEQGHVVQRHNGRGQRGDGPARRPPPRRSRPPRPRPAPARPARSARCARSKAPLPAQRGHRPTRPSCPPRRGTRWPQPVSRSSSCTSSRALPTMRTPGFAAANRAVSAVS